ncbi:DUF2767 family protein [Enterobacter asburiae]|uniref:DUF2767 family protein n=1 Tax=Enterobacter asburiae TaxID=61645 RepID=UPI00210D7CD0|nr:DUF2767 family protein [Enterobacter asburiae]
MCQVVGSIVFSLVEAGHDSTSKNIITVLRNDWPKVTGNGSRTRSFIFSWPLIYWSGGEGFPGCADAPKLWLSHQRCNRRRSTRRWPI